MKFFSSRRREVQDTYRYDVPEHVRRRVFLTLQHCHKEQEFSTRRFDDFLAEIEEILTRRYGGLRAPMYEAARVSTDPLIQHIASCGDEEFLDFVEACFRTNVSIGDQRAVDSLNAVFQEENVGYELTPYTEVVVKKPGCIAGQFRPDANVIERTYPKVIRKDEKVLHAETVKPCLDALADPRFATPNRELLAAFDEYRQGKYADAITDAGAAFESVLKVICAAKGWPYDKDRDTCSKLLDVCRDKGLFHPFYRQILEGTATIRNKVGDAHGKGPKAEYPATKELADHMLYAVCNNVNLLVSLAGLS